MERPAATNDFQVGHARLLLTSFARFVGRPLLDADCGDVEMARRLFEAQIVVVSHDSQVDPILNYGNAAALALWDVSWDQLTKMPSRLTAEAVLRSEREKLFEAVKRDGFVEGYAGVRISASGRRFKIEDAVIWSVVDTCGAVVGHAATFATYRYLYAGIFSVLS